MEDKVRSAAIIPCYNEGGTIAEVVRASLRQVATVWVVDDGSSDETAQIAEDAGARVIRHDTNLGKGASLLEGFAAAKTADVQWVFTLDGDGQHDPAEMPRFWTGADLVIGNRMGERAKMTSARRVVNRWTSARLSQRLGTAIPDSQSGFRLIRVEALKQVELRERRFTIENEMIAAFAGAGLRIDFVPISTRAAQRSSRIHPVMDTLRWFRWWWGR